MLASPGMDLTAEKILAIPGSEPERLFSKGDKGTVEAEFHALALKWHPDTCAAPKAKEVFIHLTDLRKHADLKIDHMSWEIPGRADFQSRDGRSIQIRYRIRHVFELGQAFVCDASLVYVVEPEHRDFFHNGIRQIRSFEFPDSAMRKEFERFLPRIKKQASLKDGRDLLVLAKTPDQVSLRDLFDHSRHDLDPKHVAWIVSGLLNIASYLEFSGITHNNISLDTCFISPEFHSVSLLGGWWYSIPAGEPLLGLPAGTLALLPPTALASPTASAATDLELIRALCRTLLGDPSGTSLLTRKAIPPAMVEWARWGASGSARKDYKDWMEHTLQESFGKRTFVKLAITPQQVYGGGP